MGVEAMQRLLSLPEPPTAVFTHNDVLAMGALHAIHAAGLSVPDDISVVGYDDISSAKYFAPPLTTVRHPTSEIGALAGQMILELIQKKADPPPPKTTFLPVNLIVRASTGPPPSRPFKG
ncbi:MAG: hypothetical protein KatS3mg050_0191 [Litorilinea sp.]|nr:MAG: hypothetical protein KatS3mg050_0191 [Litorilinea sp.]